VSAPRTAAAGGADAAVSELIVEGDERVGGGGFLEVRRLRLRNRRADGTASAPYICDTIARPYGQDAVVVAVYARDADGSARVLLREGLRPGLALGRDPAAAPLPEPPAPLVLAELVAGILEPGDRGEAGLRERAAAEVAEEAGFAVAPAAIEVLGPGAYPSPGAMVEKLYFTAVEVDPGAQQALVGDGSPMEEGARTRWLSLSEALAACARGDLEDLKTELALRRLRDHLAAAPR
jgi:ADP-ribose pyrophosphatase